MTQKEYLEKFTKQQFKIKDVDFYVTKMNANDGQEAFEKIRIALFDRMAKIESANFWKDIYTLLFGLPTELVHQLKIILFQYIKFKTKNEQQPIELSEHNFNAAFENLEPIHVYEILFRSLVINFFSSFETAHKKYQELVRLIEL